MATIRKRLLPSGNHVWLAEYRDGDGNRRFKQFKTRKLADDYLLTARGEVRAGVHVAEAVSVTVGKAAELWLTSVDAAGLERSTVNQYRQHVDIHIRPLIGNTLLSKLTVASVRSFEDQLRETGRSGAMVRKILVSLGSLLADAQERGLVARNVVREKSRTRQKGRHRRHERRQKGKLKVGVDIPTRDEIKAIIAALQGHWRPLLLTAIFTGLRASELRGLRWSDVDFDKREIRVHQRADRFNEIGKPKSEAGERAVPATPIVINALKEWKLVCPKGKLNLAFPNGVGKIESLSNIRNRGLVPTQLRAGVSAPKLNKAGEPEIDKEGHQVLTGKYPGMHAMRHFYASWCINRKEDGGLGLPPKVVQERLGHSSITITMDVYGHLFPRGDDADELAEAERALLA
jgi:integrase